MFIIILRVQQCKYTIDVNKCLAFIKWPKVSNGLSDHYSLSVLIVITIVDKTEVIPGFQAICPRPSPLLRCYFFAHSHKDDLRWSSFHRPLFTAELREWPSDVAKTTRLPSDRTRIGTQEVCLLNTLCCFSLPQDLV